MRGHLKGSCFCLLVYEATRLTENKETNKKKENKKTK